MSTTAEPVARIASAIDAAMSNPDTVIPAPLKPPASWFRDLPEDYVPPPQGPLVQIDLTTGRVAALVAPYGECILDGRSGCWTPGRSKTNYEYAHVGAIVTAEGETIRTANVGGGINHFDVSLATAASLAADHYANTATRRMVGRYVDMPDIGIMFLGSMYPGSTHLHAYEAMTSALSGDWRWIESLRDHEMVGAQLVNNPGFRPNPLRALRPVVASVSFRSTGAKVATATGCTDAATIVSEWTPVNAEREPLTERFARLEALTAGLMVGAVDDAPLLPPDPVDIMDLDDDGDEGEDWIDELDDLTADECRFCRGVGCAKCDWMGYTGDDDEAMVASLRANEAIIARLRRPRTGAERPRDGDGDGFVYDGTPRMRPFNPLTDLVGRAVTMADVQEAASGNRAARNKVRQRAARNFDMAVEGKQRPDVDKLIEATIGPKPADVADQMRWMVATRDVREVFDLKQRGAVTPGEGKRAPDRPDTPNVDDPDRVPGNANPLDGRTPRSPAETAVDRATPDTPAQRMPLDEAVRRDVLPARDRGSAETPFTPTDDEPGEMGSVVDDVRTKRAKRRLEKRFGYKAQQWDDVKRRSNFDAKQEVADLEARKARRRDSGIGPVYMNGRRVSQNTTPFIPDGEALIDAASAPDPDAPDTPDLAAKVLADGGFTYDPDTGTFPDEGIAVAVPGHSVIAKRDAFEADPDKFINDYLRQMRDDGVTDTMIGGWYDTANDEVVLDRVQVVADRDEAMRLGVSRDEQAVYDLSTGEEIPTGGTGGRDDIDIIGQEAAGDGPLGQADQGPDGRGDRPAVEGPVGEDGGPAAPEGVEPDAQQLIEEYRRLRAFPGGDSDTDREIRRAEVKLRALGINPADVKDQPIGEQDWRARRASLQRQRRSDGQQWMRGRGLTPRPYGSESVGDRPLSGYPGLHAQWDPESASWAYDPPNGGPRPDPDARDAYAERVQDRLADAPPPLPESADDRAEYLDDLLNDATFSPLATQKVHNSRGPKGDEWTTERQAIHDQILNEIVEAITAAGMPRDRQAIFMGGLPGAGKTFLLTKGAAKELGVVPWDLEDGFTPPEGATHVAVNADWFKLRLIELGLNPGIDGLTPMEEASYMHEESSHLGKRLERRLAEEGFNIAFDGTMGSEGSVRKKLRLLEDSGYDKPDLLFADVTPEESAASAEARYIDGIASDVGGRLVPSKAKGDVTARMDNLSRNRDTANFLAAEGAFRRGIIVDQRGVSNARIESIEDADPSFPVPLTAVERINAERRSVGSAELSVDEVNEVLADRAGISVEDLLAQRRGVQEMSGITGRIENGRWSEYEGEAVTGPDGTLPLELDIGPGGYPPRSPDKVRAMTGVTTGDGSAESPFRVSDVNTAAILLAEGQYYVDLESIAGVSTTLDRLAQFAREAEAAGRRAPNMDLCRVSIAGRNLFCAETKGYPRIVMPQLSTENPVPGSFAASLPRGTYTTPDGKVHDGGVDLSEAFMAHLDSLGYSVTRKTVDAANLKATQNQLNGAKVSSRMAQRRQEMLDRPDEPGRAIIVTSDGYIVDGHHGWATNVAIGYADGVTVDQEVYEIDGSITDILPLAQTWAYAAGSPPQGLGSPPPPSGGGGRTIVNGVVVDGPRVSPLPPRVGRRRRGGGGGRTIVNGEVVDGPGAVVDAEQLGFDMEAAVAAVARGRRR